MNAIEQLIARKMRAQLGLIQRDQALALGLTENQIEYRLLTGSWERLHPCTYRIAAGPVSAQQGLLAACLAAGPQAVASHLSAAWMWHLVPGPPAMPHLTVPATVHPRLRHVVIHRSSDLDPRRTIVRRSIPCTDPLRVVGDVASHLPREDLVQVVDGAIARRIITADGLAREVARRQGSGRPGPARVRRMLEERGMLGGPAPSVLEAEAMRLFRRAGIPVIGREVRFGTAGQYRIDFMITPALAVEVDGFAHHWSPEAKAYDEARRNQILLSGVVLLVYTWRDIRGDANRVTAEIGQAVARSAVG